MCKCTPEMRTPFCGKPGCGSPKQEETSVTNLSTIGIIHVSDKQELRLSWSNDYHCATTLKSLAPNDIKQGLIDLAYLIKAAQLGGRL